MPNSEVKRFIADGSVALRHVRVGHRQAFNTGPVDKTTGLFFEQNLPFVNYGRVRAQCVNSLSIERKNKQAVVVYASSLFGIPDLQGYGRAPARCIYNVSRYALVDTRTRFVK